MEGYFSNKNWSNLAECGLPSACRLENVNTIIDASGNERMLSKEKQGGLFCDINEGFSFDLDMSIIANGTIAKCSFTNDLYDGVVELHWPKRSPTATLFTLLNITNLFEFISFFDYQFSINVVNVKRFEYNIFDSYIDKGEMDIRRVLCTNCKFDVYYNKSTVKTCDDFIRANITKIRSIFQIYKTTIKINYGIPFIYMDKINFTIINGDLKQPLCPLLFNNSSIDMLQLIGLVDSFYKRNVLSFSNHSFGNLNSRVYKLELDKVQNIDLDFDLLNQDVFKKIESIYIYGSINRIDKAIFKSFEWLNTISFKTNYFRKIMHINGIDWIKAINSNVSVNVSDYEAINRTLVKFVNLDCYYYSQEISLASVFPDEDFCLYVDFPFRQLVLVTQLCGEYVYDLIPIDLSCTFMWLIQYYQSYYYMYRSLYEVVFDGEDVQFFFPYSDYYYNLERFMTSSKYNLTMAKCNFSLMKTLCNKSQYSVSDIWGLYDYSILTKKLEIAFKISSYVFSFLGIITNLIVIITILHKKNTDIFKGFKHYKYLSYNGILSMLISVIHMVSWISECFYPYEVFCPEIHKLAFFQVFKMVFKECFITAFRFMWNFTYIAFALNRISLIGKDHGKLVQFMSEVGVKSYLAVCFLISCGCSVVKYFKYEINYDQAESSYPISNDHDLSSIHRTHISNDGVIIANSIFDILNYVVFEVIIFILDIYMVARLRRTLEEKLKKSETFMGKKDENKLETMKKEHKEAVHKVIKMVILNTAISVLFKLPIAFIPIVNVYAEFYYKQYLNLFIYPKFGDFYSFLQDSGFYDMIVSCSDFFYNFSLFIQLFIYRHFDKQFKIGSDRLISKDYSQTKPVYINIVNFILQFI